MNLDILLHQSGEWLNGIGPESDIVISTRIRLARNISSFKFMSRLTNTEKSELEEYLSERLSKIQMDSESSYFHLHKFEIIDRLFLVERHLISKEHATQEGARGVLVSSNERISIMINEEDHLRIQILHSGLQLPQTWIELNDLDSKIEKEIDYAFSKQFGYLTGCPTNVGTGLRGSVMLHLPALVMVKQIHKVFESVLRIGFSVRGLFGEGTHASGDFYQISNQVSLGKSEHAIIENLASIVPQIVRYERNIREMLISQSKEILEDRVWRALGTLQNARVISSEETLDLLSAIRLGVNLGLIPHLSIAAVNELFIMTQPAHLQKRESQRLDMARRDEVRAEFLRSKLRP
ncbi:MAG: protein arginine kinase [Planctomycetota bacterium]